MKYEKIESEFNTQVKLNEHLKALNEEKISQLNTEKARCFEFEKRIQLQEVQLSNMPNYVKLKEEFQIREKMLEERIKDLCESPFIKEAEQRGNVYKKMQESELTVNELNVN